MSVNSLANFGVPGQSGERSPNLQPILSHRFRAVFYNFGAPGESAPYDLTREVRSVTRPSYRFEPITLYSYISTVYIPSRVEFEEMTLKFFDSIDNSIQSRIQAQLSKQQNMFDQTAYRAGQNVKFEMDIDVLAGGGSATGTASDPNIIQRWCIVGAFITGGDMGEMSYDSNNAQEITLNIRFDNATAYDHDGIRLGTFDHAPEIEGRIGTSSTGIGGFIS